MRRHSTRIFFFRRFAKFGRLVLECSAKLRATLLQFEQCAVAAARDSGEGEGEGGSSGSTNGGPYVRPRIAKVNRLLDDADELFAKVG